jgi:hypothetical protein
MNITELDKTILMLNREAQEGELEHHGSATTRFELRSNGDEMCVWFMGHTLWHSGEDEREYEDNGTKYIYEPIEAFLRRESEQFLVRIMAKPTATADELEKEEGK